MAGSTNILKADHLQWCRDRLNALPESLRAVARQHWPAGIPRPEAIGAPELWLPGQVNTLDELVTVLEAQNGSDALDVPMRVTDTVPAVIDREAAKRGRKVRLRQEVLAHCGPDIAPHLDRAHHREALISYATGGARTEDQIEDSDIAAVVEVAGRVCLGELAVIPTASGQMAVVPADEAPKLTATRRVKVTFELEVPVGTTDLGPVLIAACGALGLPHLPENIKATWPRGKKATGDDE